MINVCIEHVSVDQGSKDTAAIKMHDSCSSPQPLRLYSLPLDQLLVLAYLALVSSQFHSSTRSNPSKS